MMSNGVDLVVLEGMGRVIHTNMQARFKCDVLKVRNRYSCLYLSHYESNER